MVGGEAERLRLEILELWVFFIGKGISKCIKRKVDNPKKYGIMYGILILLMG